MPDLPRIFARPDLPDIQLPRTNPNAYGAQAFATLADVTEAMREKQKPIDAARQASEYDIAMEDLKNEVQAEPDPNNWRQVFITKEGQARAKMMEKIADPKVKEAFSLHVERSLGRHVIALSEKGIKASHVKQLSDIETVGSTLARQAAESSDEGIRRGAIGAYNAMIAGASQPTMIGGKAVPGALNAKEAEKLRENFNVNVLKNRMEMLALSQNPVDQSTLTREHNAGAFAAVPPDERARILERGRSHQEAFIARTERDKNTVKQAVYQDWSAEANFGRLTDDKINRALRGDDPFITPDQARTLKSINDNPPTGEGGDAVRAVMSNYYLGPRTIDRINATRKELQSLQSQLGRPNPLISKAANELQSDQTAVESVDVQRQNRSINEAKDLFNATTPPLPFSMPLFNNQRKRDEAGIANDIRKGMDPKTAVDKRTKQTQQRQDALPDDVKAMQKALGR